MEEGKVYLSWMKATPFFARGQSGKTKRLYKSFRVFRQEEPAFCLGQDSPEYFLGCEKREDAELVFDGSIEAIHDRRFDFVDDTVTFDSTYAYFIETIHDGLVGPFPVRVRHPERWWSYAKLKEKIDVLCQKYPKLVKTEMCGMTSLGKEIPLLVVGDAEPALGLTGAVHGGEAGPELIVPVLERLLDESPELFSTCRVVAIPSVNIDSREMMAKGIPWYLRKNQQEVDINRNFPENWDEVSEQYGLSSASPRAGTYRGPFPLSTPEAKAIVDAVKKYQPKLVLDYHGMGGFTSVPALYSEAAKGDAAFVADLEKYVVTFCEGLFPEKAFDPYWFRPAFGVGSFTTWAYLSEGIPVLTLEGQADERFKERLQLDWGTMEDLSDYQERHWRGVRNLMLKMGNE